MYIHKSKNISSRVSIKVIAWFLLAVIPLQFIVMPISQAQAQVFSELALTNSMVYLTPPYVPVILKGIKIYPKEPFKFDFIIDKGDSGYEDEELEDEVSKLVKYFLASITIPDDDLWVNLSPYEKERIIPDVFGETVMGRDLLAQDYILKQLTASLLYPENDIGSEFWKRVYSEAQEKFGTTDIPIETFNKIWIIPQKAVIYEDGEVAYVTKSKLKVMLEEDYLAMSHQNGTGNYVSDEEQEDEKVELSTQILREVVIPAIEKEVNEGKNFAPLRQIYNSLILATWFKRNLKESILGQLYLDQNKIKGVDVEDKKVKEKIYSKYLKVFQDGIYDYIKEEYDDTTQQIIPRRYFSGGTGLTRVGEIVESNGRVQDINAKVPLVAQVNIIPEVENNSGAVSSDMAMISMKEADSYGESLWEMRHYHIHETGNMISAFDLYIEWINENDKELIDGNDDYKWAFDFLSLINQKTQDIFKPKDGIHDKIQLYRLFEGFRTSVDQNKEKMDRVLKRLSNAFKEKGRGENNQQYVDDMLSAYSLFSEYLNRIFDRNLNKEKVDIAFMMSRAIYVVPSSDSGVGRLMEREMDGKVQINQQFVDLNSEGYVLEVDSLRMVEVFLNILKNANEKLADGGRIDISSNLSLSRENLVITIKDNGGGITLENPNDVFKAFVTTKGEFGTGIGLALSRSIVEEHGGAITADNWEETNEEGGILESGAIFRISLPIVRAEEYEIKTETDHAMLGFPDMNIPGVSGSNSPKIVSVKKAILANVRSSVKSRYSIEGDVVITPVSGEISEEIYGRIEYLFSEIANELIDNAVAAQKEGDIIVRFRQIGDQGVRLEVVNQGGIDWDRLVLKAKTAARNNVLFENTADGKIFSGDFYGLMDGFEPVTEDVIDALVQVDEGRLKLITAGGLTEGKGDGVQGGAGYGLQLVQGRVEQLGGVLGLESHPDSTTFIVTLPKTASVNYHKDLTVDVEFIFVDNADEAMIADDIQGFDNAMVADQNVGGIDLDTRNLEIKTIGDGAEFEFSFDMEGYANMSIVGFSPVIIQIVPIANAASFIGQ